MTNDLDRLRAQRRAIMDRLVHRVAIEIGYDVSEGLAPDLRHDLETEARAAYEQWREAVAMGAPPQTRSSALDDHLAALYAIDRLLLWLHRGLFPYRPAED